MIGSPNLVRVDSVFSLGSPGPFGPGEVCRYTVPVPSGLDAQTTLANGSLNPVRSGASLSCRPGHPGYPGLKRAVGFHHRCHPVQMRKQYWRTGHRIQSGTSLVTGSPGLSCPKEGGWFSSPVPSGP